MNAIKVLIPIEGKLPGDIIPPEAKDSVPIWWQWAKHKDTAQGGQLICKEIKYVGRPRKDVK